MTSQCRDLNQRSSNDLKGYKMSFHCAVRVHFCVWFTPFVLFGYVFCYSCPVFLVAVFVLDVLGDFSLTQEFGCYISGKSCPRLWRHCYFSFLLSTVCAHAIYVFHVPKSNHVRVIKAPLCRGVSLYCFSYISRSIGSVCWPWLWVIFKCCPLIRVFH